MTSNLKSVVKIEWKNYAILLFEVLDQKWTSLNKFERKKSGINGKINGSKISGNYPYNGNVTLHIQNFMKVAHDKSFMAF